MRSISSIGEPMFMPISTPTTAINPKIIARIFPSESSAKVPPSDAVCDGFSDFIDYDGYYDFDNYDDDQPFESQDEPSWAEPPMNRGVSFAGAGAAIAGAAAQGAPQTMVFPQEAARREQPRAQQGGAALIDTAHGKTFPLTSARQLIGRESTCDVDIPDINASRTHAELRFEQPGVWVLTDLGSTNGTLVNGRQITSQVLQGGERIVKGTTNLQYVNG